MMSADAAIKKLIKERDDYIKEVSESTDLSQDEKVGLIMKARVSRDLLSEYNNPKITNGDIIRNNLNAELYTRYGSNFDKYLRKSRKTKPKTKKCRCK